MELYSTLGSHEKAIGIFCKTREEWMVTWIASWYASGCIVPLYETLGEESIDWVVQQTELKAVVSAPEFAEKLIKLKSEGKLSSLSHIILLDQFEKQLPHDTAGLHIVTYEACIEEGRKHPSESLLISAGSVKPTTLAMICYTSGTTARPKGVMLTHRNYVSMAESVRRLPFVQPRKGQTCISWLPLAHVFEQITVVAMLSLRIKVGFYSGDMKKLTEDIQVLRPNYFGSVPRVFNRIYDKVMSETSSLTGFKKFLYEKAVASKLSTLRSSGNNTHFFYDRFVFSRIRNMLGGNLSLVFIDSAYARFTGGAPLSPKVLEMARVWLGCTIVQGYGLTETTGPVFVQSPDDIAPGSIGLPMAHCEAKIVSIPEMKYHVDDTTEGKKTPRGELWVRGPAVSIAGYWREPQLTKEAFDPQGWLRTGDVVMMLPSGGISIIDRKKYIFKLAQVLSCGG